MTTDDQQRHGRRIESVSDFLPAHSRQPPRSPRKGFHVDPRRSVPARTPARSAIATLAERAGVTVDDQGSSDPGVVLDNYLSEHERRTHRRNANAPEV